MPFRHFQFIEGERQVTDGSDSIWQSPYSIQYTQEGWQLGECPKQGDVLQRVSSVVKEQVTVSQVDGSIGWQGYYQQGEWTGSCIVWHTWNHQ